MQNTLQKDLQIKKHIPISTKKRLTEKPYILVAKDRFELNCNAWELFLALKVLFTQIEKTQGEAYKLLCKKLVDCKAFKV